MYIRHTIWEPVGWSGNCQEGPTELNRAQLTNDEIPFTNPKWCRKKFMNAFVRPWHLTMWRFKFRFECSIVVLQLMFYWPNSKFLFFFSLWERGMSCHGYPRTGSRRSSTSKISCMCMTYITRHTSISPLQGGNLRFCPFHWKNIFYIFNTIV